MNVNERISYIGVTVFLPVLVFIMAIIEQFEMNQRLDELLEDRGTLLGVRTVSMDFDIKLTLTIGALVGIFFMYSFLKRGYGIKGLNILSLVIGVLSLYLTLIEQPYGG